MAQLTTRDSTLSPGGHHGVVVCGAVAGTPQHKRSAQDGGCTQKEAGRSDHTGVAIRGPDMPWSLRTGSCAYACVL